MTLSSTEALERLKQGNNTFVSATDNNKPLTTQLDRAGVQGGQSPFAIVLGCADSRVPAEHVFHCGLGDLFVVRVAGNIALQSQLGSIEFACENFGTQLIVVLGHSKCGAVDATVKALGTNVGNADTADISDNLASIVNAISEAVAPVVQTNVGDEHSELVSKAMRANVEHSVARLTDMSAVLARLVEADKLAIVGADYCLQTGRVTFYDG